MGRFRSPRATPTTSAHGGDTPHPGSPDRGLGPTLGRLTDPDCWRWVPPTITLPEDGWIGDFDRVADAWFARHVRGRRLADTTFYAASALGDHGIIWLALAGVQAARLRDADWRRRLVRAAAGLGVESALVNGPVKWMFRRRRPVHDGPRALYLRQPRTSSFPSGHATAAFFAAALLREDDPWWPGYYALASIVALSRLHVKIHHASDVAGGALLGAALGELTRAMVPLHPAAAPGDGGGATRGRPEGDGDGHPGVVDPARRGRRMESRGRLRR